MGDAVNHPGPHDAVAALEKLRTILSAAQGQVTIALEEIARLPSPPRRERSACPRCGILRPTSLMEAHLEAVHGEEPELPRESGEVADVNGLTTLGREATSSG